MKNLKHYHELSESASNGGKHGYLLFLKGYERDSSTFMYYAGVCDNFYTFAQAVMEYFGAEPGDEGMELENMKDIDDVAEFVNDVNEFREFEYCFWSGLTPRRQEDEYTDIPLDNSYITCGELERLFTNSKEVMLKDPNGNQEDLTYIAKSIEVVPDALNVYIDEPRFEKIIDLTSWDDKKKNAMRSYSKTKGML
jgi:hypothetical protein